ncbi:MAG: dehypoxanthine futalosine cyclase [Candidatus Dadabacteria bacterium]|nr:dehypoxanthine futalosine cyclase [Candidatus Dadabacteria bacterium]NIQ13543.1 dehypoxanthine futalosine cyclase [Candidatus Dadabacteria bacterium]
MNLDKIYKKINSNQRISADEALTLLQNADLLQLGSLANLVRKRFNPDNTVTFVADTNPNYTNVCDTECLFCAFWRPPGANDAYTYDVDKIVEIMRTSYHNGATTVLLQGGHNPDLHLDYYTDIIKRTTKEIPDLHLHAFSAPEIAAIAKYENLSTKEVLQSFWDAGLRTIPGGGAEILTNKMRKKISPLKIDADEWMRITREAHLIGFKTTATMMFGHFEEDEDIIEHISRIRELQDETGNFLAFIPWIFKPKNTFLERKLSTEIGGDRYLRVLSVCRIFLDNFKHIQGSWFTLGKKMGSISMHYGASDLGGTLYDENVLGCAENKLRSSIDELVHMIKSAGFKPAQRNTYYDIINYF